MAPVGKRVRKGVRPPQRPGTPVKNGCPSIHQKHRENHRELPYPPVQDQINPSRHPFAAPKSLIGRFRLQGTPLWIMTQGWQSPTTSHAISFTALVMSQSVGTFHLTPLRLPVLLPLHCDKIRMREGPRNTADSNVINDRPVGEGKYPV